MFTHVYVNFYIKYEGHQNWSKILSMDILRVFDHHHIWCQNWHQYVWTSSCQFIFFVNLLHSPCVWLFDIWHLFDNLTSFDIFITCTCSMGKAIISHLSLCSQGGVLSLAEGTYPGWGVHTLAREVPYLAGVLTFVWSTHLARGLPTFASGYLPWLGRYLPWLGDTYPGFEVPTLTRKGTCLG